MRIFLTLFFLILLTGCGSETTTPTFDDKQKQEQLKRDIEFRGKERQG